MFKLNQRLINPVLDVCPLTHEAPHQSFAGSQLSVVMLHAQRDN